MSKPNRKLFFSFTTQALTICLLLLSIGLHAQGPLRTSGKQIINDNGNILLRGTNLGNWLINEGYIMDIGDKSHTGYWNEIADIVGGQTKAQNIRNRWMDNFIVEADIDSIAKSGYNCVRVPFHYNLFYNTSTNSLTNDGFAYLDDLLTWCENHKIYAILDMHAAPGGQNWSDHGDGNGDAALWSNYNTNKWVAVDIWEHIAKRYKDNDWVGGYDLLNEPDMAGGDEWKLRDVYVAMTLAIRRTGDNHIIFAEGKNHAVHLGVLKPKWDNNMAFSVHNYWEDFPAPFWQDQINDANDQNIPLWLGEFGENSNNWNNEMVRLAESQGVHWTIWSYKKVGSMSNSMGVGWSDGYWKIKEYIRGWEDKPNATTAYNDFMQFAQEVNITSGKWTRHHMDFDDAVLRSDFHTTPKPYANFKVQALQTILLPAWQYDMGANNVGSKDKKYEITCRGCGTWNDGWMIRNDGVDIQWPWTYREDWQEWNRDTSIYNFSQGDGEWLKYTIDFQATGSYRFRFKAATGNSGKLKVTIDGTQKSISIPSSGWDKFSYGLIPSIEIAGGVHTIKVEVESGAVNFKEMIIQNLTAGNPEVNFTASDQSLCTNEPVTYSNASSNFTGQANYTWDFGSGATPSSANGAGPHVVTYSTTGSKNVKLTVTDGSSYSETKNGIVNIDCVIGLDKEKKSVKIISEIYPNPTNGMVTISGETRGLEAFIYSPSGTQIKHNSTDSNSLQIDLHDEEPGMYLVKVCAANGCQFKRILKSK